MKVKAEIRSKQTVLRLTLIGLAAGFINGLLGAGGGIIIVFGMMPLISHDKDAGRDIFANALAVMLPVSFVSVITYLVSGRLENNEFGLYVIPAAVGGIIGAYILDKMKIAWLKKAFAIIVIWSGIYMIMK